MAKGNTKKMCLIYNLGNYECSRSRPQTHFHTYSCLYPLPPFPIGAELQGLMGKINPEDMQHVFGSQHSAKKYQKALANELMLTPSSYHS